ncbi:hypothetical protein D3C75_904500 [compost metagenome]
MDDILRQRQVVAAKYLPKNGMFTRFIPIQPRVIHQVFQRRRVRDGMLISGDHRVAQGVQRFVIHTVMRGVIGRRNHGDIQPLVFQRIVNLLRAAFHHDEFHSRVTSLELNQRVGEWPVRGGRGESHP